MIPHEKERENVEEVIGEDASIVFITTPGQVLQWLHIFYSKETEEKNYEEKPEEIMLKSNLTRKCQMNKS